VRVWGDNFVGARLVALDDPTNTRLASPYRDRESVSWTVCPLPAWLTVCDE
jgi:hypothetical protein